jgi:hypothetical protein
MSLSWKTYGKQNYNFKKLQVKNQTIKTVSVYHCRKLQKLK